MLQKVFAKTMLAVTLVISFVILPIVSGSKAFAEDVVTIAHNGYFDKTFGPGLTPIEAIRAEVAKRYPDIKIELKIIPYEVAEMYNFYREVFKAKDGGVDLIGVSIYWTSGFAENNWLLPLNDVIDAKVTEKLNPSYLEAFTHKGQLVALGPYWGGIGGLYYRKDLLAQYGFEPPTTYKELVQIANTIMTDSPELMGWVWPARKDQVVVNRWIEFFNGFGGQYFDEVGKCTMNNEEGVNALKFMSRLFKDEITPVEALSWKEEDVHKPFVQGNAIFFTGRQDLTFWLDDPEKSQIAHKWSFIPLPADPKGQRSGFFEGWGFGISAYSDNPEAAAKVLEVMFGFEVQKQFNLAQGPVQAHMDLYTDADVIKNNPHMPLIESVAATAVTIFPSVHNNEIVQILQEELHLALLGLKSAKAALNDACEQIDTLQ